MSKIIRRSYGSNSVLQKNWLKPLTNLDKSSSEADLEAIKQLINTAQKQIYDYNKRIQESYRGTALVCPTRATYARQNIKESIIVRICFIVFEEPLQNHSH